MDPKALLVITALVLIALAPPIAGFVLEKRSLLVIVLNLCVALATVFGGLYAWFESKSLAFAVAYGTIALIALASTGVQIKKK